MSNIDKAGILATHRSYLGNETKISLSEVSSGDVVRFLYDGEQRTVFVLDPDWKRMMHGLSMEAINRRDLMVEIVSKRNSTVDSLDFYKRFGSSDTVKRIDCYRTYKINKIQNIRRMEYVIDERGREEL